MTNEDMNHPHIDGGRRAAAMELTGIVYDRVLKNEWGYLDAIEALLAVAGTWITLLTPADQLAAAADHFVVDLRCEILKAQNHDPAGLAEIQAGIRKSLP